MGETAIIGARFNGPPHSGNGGYVCGLVAGLIGGPARVMLKSPPPLETPLNVERSGDAVRLTHDGVVIAEGSAAPPPDVAPPASVSLAAAEAATGYDAPDEHYFPSCFVCGPDRAEGDGLRIFAGSVDGADMVASLWRPDDSLAAPDGLVAGEHVWAALDCPSCFAFRRPDLRVLLGSLTAVVHRRPTPRETYVVVAWPERSEGRKHFSAAALLDAEGEVMARAQALWIELKPEAIAAMKAGG